MHSIRSTIKNLIIEIQEVVEQHKRSSYSMNIVNDSNVTNMLTMYATSTNNNNSNSNINSNSTNSSNNNNNTTNASNILIEQHDIRQLLDQLKYELKSVNTELSFLFNKQFGSIFRTDGHPTIFSWTVKQIADLYMNDVTNLLNYSTEYHFYPDQPVRMVSYGYDYIVIQL